MECDNDNDRPLTDRELNRKFEQLVKEKEPEGIRVPAWAIVSLIAVAVILILLTMVAGFKLKAPAPRPQQSEISPDVKALISAMQPALQQQQDNREQAEADADDRVSIALAKAKEERDARLDLEHEREALNIKAHNLLREQNNLLAQIEKLKKQKAPRAPAKCEVPDSDRVQALSKTSKRVKLECWEEWEVDPSGTACWKKGGKKNDPKSMMWLDEVQKKAKGKQILSADPATGEPKLIKE